MKKDRMRLSIDLEAYPDIKVMLLDAIEATGETQTALTMLALERQLPGIVMQLLEQRKIGAEAFFKKYPHLAKLPGLDFNEPKSAKADTNSGHASVVRVDAATKAAAKFAAKGRSYLSRRRASK